MEEEIKRLTELVQEAVKNQPTAGDFQKIKDEIAELKEADNSKKFESEIHEIKELLTAVQEKSLDRDQVLEILETFKETDESEQVRKHLVEDQSTEWTLVQEKNYGDNKETEYAFLMDCRFSPASRYVKAGIDENVGVPGAGTQVGVPINELRAGNPFDGQVQMISVGMNGAFQLIDMTTMNFVEEDSVPDTRTATGGSASRTINVKNYKLHTHVSDAALEDVAAYRMAIEEAVAMADANKKGEEIFATAKASVIAAGATSFVNVKTGGATALPSAANVVEKLADVKGALPAPYRVGARWHISRELETVIAKSKNTNSVYNFNPTMGLMTLWGFPVHVNDHCEDGGSANDVSCLFGNFRRGLGCGERVTLEVKVYEQTLPGALTFFARTRFAPAVNDPRAIIGLRSAA